MYNLDVVKSPTVTHTTRARNLDPATSKEAAARIKPKVASIKDRMLADLAANGPSVGEEIAARTGIRLNSITPRFADLYRDSKIRCSGTVRKGQTVWVLV